MNTLTCHIHNQDFGYEKQPEFGYACPLCQREEIVELATRLRETTKQRDALLEAIQIKRDSLLTATNREGGK